MSLKKEEREKRGGDNIKISLLEYKMKKMKNIFIDL